MPLFADGPTFVIGWETGVAVAAALGGAITAAFRLLVNYHSEKDEAHRKQVLNLVTSFETTSARQHEDCREDKSTLIGVVQTFTQALGELKAERGSPRKPDSSTDLTRRKPKQE